MDKATGRSITISVAAAAATAIVAAGVISLAMNTPSANAAADTGDWGNSVSLIDDKRTSADEIPSNFDVDSSIRATSQLLGSEGTASYWTAVDSKGDICLTVTFEGSMDIAMTSCIPEKDFMEHGVPIQANTVDGATVAYLLPDSLVGAKTNQDLSALHPNLLVGDPFAVGQTAEKLVADDGATINLPGFGEPGDYTKAPE
ncbi:hypothetical protein [Microbacterium sp. LMC-P-041]|uniref:hypothetical protein n=1 Tax=Microbacterium sp. LMC-P-041 TaxID=3040293 RepID=UPI0025525ECB|nr:hypothetical protein [Microbacterium sp. LMC-P-041]